MSSILGKIILIKIFEKSLDKLLRMGYNGNSGAGVRQRPAILSHPFENVKKNFFVKMHKKSAP
jgi:hypothetical protein